jgi:hypothetical protein
MESTFGRVRTTLMNLAEWLRGLGLGQYAPTLAETKGSGEVAPKAAIPRKAVGAARSEILLRVSRPDIISRSGTSARHEQVESCERPAGLLHAAT